jgi:hypothetical protein
VHDAIPGGADGGAGAGALEPRVPDRDFIGACPDCGSQLAFIEGCAKCHVCGFSECG